MTQVDAGLQKRGRESGQAVLLVVLAMSVFLLAGLGLAIDLPMLYGHLQMAQAAADGAAQAGALSLFHRTNATGAHPFAASTPAGPYTCSSTDATVPCAFARMNGFGTSTDDTVTVSFPTSVTGVNLAAGNAAVSVIIRRTVVPSFLRMIGAANFPVARMATAALVKVPLANCITSLNPSAADALHVAGNGNVNLSGCGIAVNSASGSAFTVGGNGSVRADTISVVGGAPLPGGNGTVNPQPTTNVPPMTDPLLTVPAPNYSSHCDYTNETISNGSVRLTPGTYCNGIAISGHGQVAMDPGTYVLLGGGLSVTGSNASLAGSNVTFYNTFDASHTYTPIVLSGGATVNLSASIGGPLTGMLFFQDRNAPLGSAQSFAGNPSVNLTGSLYFPRSAVSYAGNPSLTLNVAIVGDTISWTGNGYLTENLAQAGAPQQTRVALVE